MKYNYTNNKSSGFTLVELSIVLVIIGLLIGGILVAQSMIETVKTQSFVRQIQQIDAAVSNFKTKYNGLPGDSSKMGCISGGNTCDDGVIASIDNAYRFDFEVANFWVHLQNSGFAASSPRFTATVTTYITNSGTAPNILQSNMSATTGIIGAVDGYSYFGYPNNMYALADYSLASANLYDGIGFAITPVQALAIDAKMDDGVANAGIVRAMTGGYVAGSYPMGQMPALGTCVTAGSLAVYKTTSTKDCNLMIKMLSQSGGNI